ncbi:succinate dehydrogenase, cytochrome b556 subunit [Candidatus Bodocaedibacter vickermanii]|uniref:Succinate dehydrogenase cytochrome b556 subunit n=1 Tax=Candidatus Bodocaedibacter vickermanii TaxID=2741701 RepID=A0A7L9RU66_9PROT|nr:succinate dehydrogenase, cytochrome b556 subunit [Candidatus Paracaedibacteraceae bacterium 'Lake Konstanz']
MIDRPLSPHLQIYKLPLAAIISISHRVMGGVLFVSAIVISLLCFAWFAHIDFNWITSLIFSWLGKIKATWLIVGVVFYALAEIRYIVWGLNHGISPTFVSTSNMLIVTATFVISAMCWVKMWGGL